MRVAIYARVSSESQEARGTIGSQLEVLRQRVATEGHALVAEYCDDGCSGAQLDRPGLDQLRDAAAAGALDAVWCLSPDRLARKYAYQVIVLDEFSRLGVAVLFHDTPPQPDDPQTHLLTQVQGVIASTSGPRLPSAIAAASSGARAGEVITWKCAYGYRRLPRCAERAAHLEVYEPEAAIVRRIFRDYVQSNLSIRQITWHLNQDGVASPSGKAIWGPSTIGRLLRNETYVGRAYYNRTASVAERHPGTGQRQVRRPPDQWIAIAVPTIVSDELFAAAQQVSHDNTQWSPRRAEPKHWLLRGLVQCGHCGVTVSCQKATDRRGNCNRYYYCRNHDTFRAGASTDAALSATFAPTSWMPSCLNRSAPRCYARTCCSPARQPCQPTLRPATTSCSLPSSRGLIASLSRRRPSGGAWRISIKRVSSSTRSCNVAARNWKSGDALSTAQRQALIVQHAELAQQNRLRERVEGFTDKVKATIDHLDFDQRQKLLRLVIDEVRVQGWQIEIKLRIPLESPPEPPGTGLSIKDRLRSLHGGGGGAAAAPARQSCRSVRAESALAA